MGIFLHWIFATIWQRGMDSGKEGPNISQRGFVVEGELESSSLDSGPSP